MNGRQILLTWMIGGLCSLAPAWCATVADLRCEYRVDPLGVDSEHPRLTWTMASDRRGERQTAYQILVATSREELAADRGTVWDSGKIQSDQSALIPYAGAALNSRQHCVWKVRVWDRDSAASPWSASASWSMGLLKAADWRGRWIMADADPKTKSPLPLFRKSFVVKKTLRHAELMVCGLGQFAATINGSAVSDAILEPGWTNYKKTCLYRAYDVTTLVKSGETVLGVALGNGMYNVTGGRYTKFTGSFGPPKLIAQLHLDYADGSSDCIASDATWTTTPGPITFSCVYGGEDHDARLEKTNWDRPGFAATGWTPALETTGPGGDLKSLSASAPPIRRFEILKPVSSKTIKPNVTVYDLGQNAALVPRVTVTGPAGSVVRIIPSELIKGDGSVDRGSCAHGGKPAYCQYTLRGGGEESWSPAFYYHGCRYLQIECSAPAGGELPTVTAMSGVVVHADSTPVGTFACSSDLFTRIHTLIRWAQRSNMMSVMTDCPHREKLGWLEENHLNGPSLRYEFDFAPLSEKMMNDMADAQLDNGLVPDIAPEYLVFKGGFRDSPEWGSAFLLVAWQQYEFSGDLTLLRRHYEGMKRYVAYLGSKAKDHIVSHGLGDWYDIGPKPPGEAQLTPKALTATAFYFADAEVVAKTAALLGNQADAQTYATLAADIRAAFIAKFFDAKTGQFSTGSQCANAIPLVMGLAQPEQRATALAGIVDDVQKRGNAITAGDVGYRYLLRALADGGRSDVIFAMNNQSDKPGYGYQLKQGATALTEAWSAERRSSQNHFMLGQIMEWFYHDLVGIGSDPMGPGFAKIIIKPAIVGDLTWAEGSYASIRGPIASRWQIANGRVTLTVAIPANTTATVWIPTHGSADECREGEQPLAKAAGVTVVGKTSDALQVTVGSGCYVFSAPW